MILIQRIKKIKLHFRSSWFKEILWDVIFYSFFFVIGVVFVFTKTEEGRVKPMLLEDNSPIDDVLVEDKNGVLKNDKKYVASSRGKYFYLVGSSRANTLSDKNKMYFDSAEEAKKLGFKPYFAD